MAKIPKKLQKPPPVEKNGSSKDDSKDDRKERLAAPNRPHDFRSRGQSSVRVELDEKSKKQIAFVKKLTLKGK